MTTIDIFSGFLGAGKTTLIKKLIKEAYTGEKLVLIENEFGEIGIDGGFLQEAGIEITEMNSGCICCSLVGDFGKALHKVLTELAPDRILIEPSGVGKLSDVVRAVQNAEGEARLGSLTTVADANKCKMYMKNFGEFYNDQVEHATTIILSRTDGMSQQKLDTCVALLKEKNPHAVLITTPWDQLTGQQIRAAMEQQDTLEAALAQLTAEETCPVCGGHHEHHHDEECGCHEHHEHHHDEECGCHEHHEHHHDEECGCHEHHEHHHDEECGCHDHHEHHHDEECDCHEHHEHHHDEECSCGCHDHDHHHHHADEVFTSWGTETARKFTAEEVSAALQAMDETGDCGVVLRAKGILPAVDGSWIHFDYVPGESSVRTGAASVMGRLCVIGSGLHEDRIQALFHLN